MTLDFVQENFIIGQKNPDIKPSLVFFRKGFRIGNGKVTPDYRDIILKGDTALTLVNAKANSLNYLKLFGATEQVPETYLDTVTLSGGCEQRNLPSEYTQVEYLEVATTSTNQGAYFLTGINATVDTDMGVTASNITSASAQILVAQCVSGGDYFRIAKAGASQRLIGNFGSSSVTDNNTDGENKFTARINKSGFYVNGSLVGTFSDIPSSFTGIGAVDIFRGRYSDTSYFAYKGARFYSAWVDDNIFLPCRRNSDNRLGIYNTKTGQFILPSGTGTFTAGADVTTPSPDNPIDIISNNGAIKVSKNVFDYKYFYDNYQTYQTSGVGRCPIKLKPNTTYTISTNRALSSGNSAMFVVVGNSIDWSPATANNGVLPNSPRTLATDSSGYLCFGMYISSSYAVPESDFDNGTVWVQIEEGSTATSYMPYGQIYTDGTVEQVTDSLGNTANAERLLAVGNYKDTQEVLNGSVTKRVGIKVLDGTESGTWNFDNGVCTKTVSEVGMGNTRMPLVSGSLYSSHFIVSSYTPAKNINNGIFVTSTGYFGFSCSLIGTTDEQIDSWLATQYANGTPVIVVYSTSSATTSTVTGQFLSKSPVTQTAGSISGLPIAITESSHTTPTPTQPLDINCNNGVVKVSKNLFDKNQEFVNGYINDSGQLVSFESLQTTANYIPVLPNTTYTISFTALQTSPSNFNVSTWTSNNAFYGRPVRSPITSTGQNQYTFTTQSAVTKIKVSLWANSNIYTDFQIVQGSTATPYTPYSPTGIYVDGTTETVEITGKNLFDVATKIEGYYIDVNGNLAENENFSYSALIPVVEGSTYMWSGTSTRTTLTGKRIHGYNSNGEWVQQINSIAAGSGNYSLSATIPSEVAYIRISGMRINDSPDTNVQVELGSSATTYEEYYNGGTATAENLFKVGTYQDVQEVLAGGVTKRCGIKVLDGTEDWIASTSSNIYILPIGNLLKPKQNLALTSTHFIGTTLINANMPDNSIKLTTYTTTPNNGAAYIKMVNASSLSGFKQFLSDQYNAGSPVIIVYPLATPTTETVTAQPMNIQAGTNIVQITQASMDDLELEVKYKAGVAVTIEEIEDAQLDNNVEVTING